MIGRLADQGVDPADAPLAYQSALVTPVGEGDVWAAIALYDHRRDRFDAADATAMWTVAEQVAEPAQRAPAGGVRAAGAPARPDHRGGGGDRARADHRRGAGRRGRDRLSGPGYSAAVAIRVLPETAEQVVVANLGAEGTTAPGLRRPIATGTVGAVIAAREQLVLGDATGHPAFDWPARCRCRRSS